MNYLEHIQHYCDLGWALTPVQGKMPKNPGWQRTTPQKYEDVQSVWTGWAMQGMNPGLVLGSSNVADFELDSDDVTAFLDLLGGEIPKTPAYRSGTGRYHVLFRNTDPNLTRFQKSGMELRAGSHQSVLPPAIHPETGKEYEWIPGHEPWNVELQGIPPRVMEFFVLEADGRPGGMNYREALRAERKLSHGEGRHQSLVSFLGRYVNIVDDVDQLIDAAKVYALQTQDPPYPEHTIEVQARDAWRRYREEGQVFNPEVTEERALERLKVKRLSDVKVRPIRFLWKPYLQQSAFHLLAGQKGAGKGSLLAYWAAQITTGALGDRPRAVLWIGTEDSAEIDVKPRFLVQGGDEEMLYIVEPDSHIVLPADLPYIHQFCSSNDVGMVVLDPLVGVIGSADTNSEGPIVQAIGGLNAVADALDMLVIGVRHLGKSVRDSGALSAVLGGVAWVNTPRAVLGLARTDAGEVILEVLAGNRSKHNDPYQYQIETATLEGLEEEVTKIVPVGPASSSVDDVISGGRGGVKDNVNYEKTKEWILEALDGRNLKHTDLLRKALSDVPTNAVTVKRAVQELKDVEGKIRFYKGLEDEWMLELVY